MNSQILHKLAYGCGQKKLVIVSNKGQRLNGVPTLEKKMLVAKLKGGAGILQLNYFISKTEGGWMRLLSHLYIYSGESMVGSLLEMTAFLSSSPSAAAAWSRNYHPSLGCLAL